MTLSELVGKRVRIWLDGTRGKGRTVGGVVEGAPGAGYCFPDPDGRGYYVIDETRVLDVEYELATGLDGGGIRYEWEPVFDARTHRKNKAQPKPKALRKTTCSHCGKAGHNRLSCSLPKER